MNKLMNKLMGSGILMAALAGVAKAQTEFFTLPAADVTQVKTDFKTAAQAVIGVVLLVFAYKLIRRLLGK